MSQKITKQFRNLLLDKLIVCHKELISLKQILCFYEYQYCQNPNSTNSHTFTYNSNFIYLLKNTNTLIEKTEKLYKKINQYHKNSKYASYAEFLTQIGCFENHVFKIIQKIGLLQRKAAQANEEIFDQYIPKSTFQRRHSNKSLTAFIEQYFLQLFKKYHDSEDLPPILVWGYRNKFRVYNTIFDATNGHTIIENAFWYFEIPRLIPALTHEFGHLLQNSDHYKNFQDTLKKKLHLYEEISPLLIQKDASGNLTLAEEFFGDIIGYKEMGESYLFTLILSILPTRFYHLFGSLDEKLECETIFSMPDIQEDEWHHLIITFARIYFLMEIAEKDRSEFYSNMESFLNNLLSSPENIKRGLKEIYSIHDIAKSRFDEFWKISMTLAKLFKDVYDSEFTSISKQDTEDSINYKDIFIQLWQKHFNDDDKWHHPKHLREKILKSIFQDTTHWNYEPYELTFVKLRTDHPNNNSTNHYFDSIFYISDNENKVKITTFGIYHQAYILPKETSIEYKKFFEQKTYQENTQQHTPFYTYKTPLIELCNKQFAQNDTAQKGSFDLILQLMLHHSSSQDISIINKIQNGKNKIIEVLNTNLKNIDCAYTLYKALGPNDFVVHISHLSIEQIYAIKNAFTAQHNIFRRTYSIIGFQGDDPIKQNIKDPFRLVSKVRLIATSHQLIKDQISKYAESIKELHYTTGVTDLAIVWENSKVSLQEIQSFAKVKDQYIASDIQTFIEKEYELP